MDISCDVIRDLLPLYAEDLTSKASNELIDGHLCGCDECTKQLGILKKAAVLPVETDLTTLKRVKKDIIRRRSLSIMTALLTLVSLAFLMFTFLFAPFQLTKEQALDEFYVREDGAVVIDYSSAVIGRMRQGRDDNWYLIQYSTRYDMWKGENRKSVEELYGTDGSITEEELQRYQNIDICMGRWESEDGLVSSDSPVPGVEGHYTELESEKNWWYADPAGMGKDVLLHDAGKAVPEREKQFSPVYPTLFFGCGVAAIGLFLLKRCLKKPWLTELATRFCILFASVAVSTLYVSSGRIFTDTSGIIDQYWGWMIGTNSVFLTLTALFARQLYLLNQQDKGK